MKLPAFFLLSFFLAIVMLNSCRRPTASSDSFSEKEELPPVPQKVQFSKVKKGDFPMQIISTGILHAEKKVQLQFQTSGHIAQLKIHNGAKVKAGQLLAVLENKDQKYALENAKVAVEAAKIEFNSLMLGYSSGENDTSKIDPVLLQSLKIQSGLSEALLNKKQAELALGNTFLRAPFPGIIAGLKNQQYDFITPTNTFCTLLDNQRFYVDFSVTEEEIGSLYIGEKVWIKPFADENIEYGGHISEIDPMVDDNGIVKIRAILLPDNRKNNEKGSKNFRFLMDGMNVKIIIYDNIPGQLVIPKQAVILRSNRKVVFTYSKGLAKWHYIQTLYENNKSYAVSKGLKVGDTIIIKGNLNLAHNAKVAIDNHYSK